ncbi:YHYH domain-containing protein [Aliivibrio fischeri]|uniref:YHYH domain-containing protein n=1 Tax=Aliivibrio fischeri TaxID=668 RepID=UPI0012D99823|nr:YHYH domain-containing protein [Aliivibrio fischeri]MUL00884.1 YHYH domain-containing protein [Aliivibrio fischeri]
MKYFLLILVFATSFSHAHSGRTNSAGCHNDNINGGYHCHGGGNSSSSSYNTVSTSSSYQNTTTNHSNSKRATSKWGVTKGGGQVAHFDEPVWFVKTDGYFYLLVPLNSKANNGSFSVQIDNHYHTSVALESVKKGWSLVEVDDLVLHRMKKGYKMRISNFRSEMEFSLIGFTAAFNKVKHWG